MRLLPSIRRRSSPPRRRDDAGGSCRPLLLGRKRNALTICGRAPASDGKISRGRDRYRRNSMLAFLSLTRLSLDHAGLAAAGTRILDAGERVTIAALADRRLAHEPVARIVGSKEFWSLRLQHRFRDAGAAPGNGNPRRSGAGGNRCRRIAHTAACGSPISAPGRARSFWRCSSELPNAFGVGTDTSFGALRRRAGQRPASAAWRGRPLLLATWARRSPDHLI